MGRRDDNGVVGSVTIDWVTEDAATNTKNQRQRGFGWSLTSTGVLDAWQCSEVKGGTPGGEATRSMSVVELMGN